MPCVTTTDEDIARYYEAMLCKACKYLTPDQIATLTHYEYGHWLKAGLDWYSNHLRRDVVYNDDPKEKDASLKELHRIGYDILYHKDDHSIAELVKLK